MLLPSGFEYNFMNWIDIVEIVMNAVIMALVAWKRTKKRKAD